MRKHEWHATRLHKLHRAFCAIYHIHTSVVVQTGRQSCRHAPRHTQCVESLHLPTHTRHAHCVINTCIPHLPLCPPGYITSTVGKDLTFVVNTERPHAAPGPLPVHMAYLK